MDTFCPCGSGLEYDACCKPLHSGERIAPTAESLMRSRYSAYAMHQVDYLKETLHPDKRRAFDPDTVRRSMKKVEWLGLTVTGTVLGGEQDSEGEVSFRAAYRSRGVPGEIVEHSRFVKEDGRWLYVDGDVSDPEPQEQVRSAKVGRNEPCPCGSGKKYKKCCG